MVNTAVTLCGLPLENPIIPASGTFSYGYEFAQIYDINCLGTFSFKGTTLAPRYGNPTPRIAEYAGGLLNSVGLQNPGVEAVIREELPRLREQCGDRAVLRAIHYFEENARTLAQRDALVAGDFAAFARLVEKSGHSSFECCQNVYCASSPKHQGLSAALAISQSILAGTGGAWRMQGGGFAGTIQAFVPDALIKRYCAAMEALFGPGCCYLLSLREQGTVRVM